MPPPRIHGALRALSSIHTYSLPTRPSIDALCYLRALNDSPSTTNLNFVRHATHQAQGRANGAKNGPGKRLGAKKTAGMFSSIISPFASLRNPLSAVKSGHRRDYYCVDDLFDLSELKASSSGIHILHIQSLITHRYRGVRDTG